MITIGDLFDLSGAAVDPDEPSIEDQQPEKPIYVLQARFFLPKVSEGFRGRGWRNDLRKRRISEEIL